MESDCGQYLETPRDVSIASAYLAFKHGSQRDAGDVVMVVGGILSLRFCRHQGIDLYGVDACTPVQWARSLRAKRLLWVANKPTPVTHVTLGMLPVFNILYQRGPVDVVAGIEQQFSKEVFAALIGLDGVTPDAPEGYREFICAGLQNDLFKEIATTTVVQKLLEKYGSAGSVLKGVCFSGEGLDTLDFLYTVVINQEFEVQGVFGDVGRSQAITDQFISMYLNIFNVNLQDQADEIKEAVRLRHKPQNVEGVSSVSVIDQYGVRTFEEAITQNGHDPRLSVIPPKKSVWEARVENAVGIWDALDQPYTQTVMICSVPTNFSSYRDALLNTLKVELFYGQRRVIIIPSDLPAEQKLRWYIDCMSDDAIKITDLYRTLQTTHKEGQSPKDIDAAIALERCVRSVLSHFLPEDAMPDLTHTDGLL